MEKIKRVHADFTVRHIIQKLVKWELKWFSSEEHQGYKNSTTYSEKTLKNSNFKHVTVTD